jgi:23S rRNA (cytosine1962-C5)-methyltransferase
MPEDFDLIVLDPPAFAKNRASVDKAARGYKEINLQALRKIKSGGILASFSCSQHISRDLFQKILFAAALDAGREVNILQVLGQPADHPVSLFHPEGDYLKGLLLYVV